MTGLGIVRKSNPATMIRADTLKTTSGTTITIATTTIGATMTTDATMIIEETTTTEAVTIIIVTWTIPETTTIEEMTTEVAGMKQIRAVIMTTGALPIIGAGKVSQDNTIEDPKIFDNGRNIQTTIEGDL